MSEQCTHGVPLLRAEWAVLGAHRPRRQARSVQPWASGDDIAASQLNLALTTLQRWRQSKRLADEHFAFIARNSLRNQLKDGCAYAILGNAHDAPLVLTPLTLERAELRAGDILSFSAALTATATAPVHVTIVTATTGQNGQPREKVSFLRRATAKPGKELRLAKAYPLRSTARPS